MATSRVRHRGLPPRDIDHGPANGAGQGGALGAHAEVARLSAYAPSKLVGVGERLEGGAGAIERRQASDAQREAWRQPPATPSPIAPVRPALGSRDHLQQSRMRGGERNRQLVAAARAPLITLADPPVIPVTPEEPVMAIEPPPAPFEDALAVALAALNDASLEAIEAYSNHQIAERRWEQARDALVACYRDTGLLAVQGGYPVGNPIADDDRGPLGDADDEDLERGLADHPPDPTSTPSAAFAAFSRDKAAAAGGGPATKQDRILAAIVPSAGDLRAIAAANNTTPGNVTATLHNAGKRHRLTADMLAVLPASFAKYSGV